MRTLFIDSVIFKTIEPNKLVAASHNLLDRLYMFKPAVAYLGKSLQVNRSLTPDSELISESE